MSQESDALGAGELIERLKGTGLFDKYNYKQVMSACLFMIARALHLQKKFQATACLNTLRMVVQSMREAEEQHGGLQAMLNHESAPS